MLLNDSLNSTTNNIFSKYMALFGCFDQPDFVRSKRARSETM